MFQDVTVPGQGEDPTPHVLLAEITAWVRSTPLQALITHSGGGLAADRLAAQLAYLDEFTASAWNFGRRVSDGPKERNQVDADAISGLDEGRCARPGPAQAAEVPRLRPCAHAGRLVRANLWRTPYTAHLLNHGISAGDVSAITVYRGLARNDADPSRDEFKLLEEFGLPQRDYEWEVMQDGLRRAFGLPEFTVERESDPSAKGAQRFRAASAATGGRRVSLIVAPALEPGRRPKYDGRLPLPGRPGSAREAGRADPGHHDLHLRPLPACDRAAAPGSPVRLQRRYGRHRLQRHRR